MAKKTDVLDEEEAPQTPLQMEEARLIQIKNEKVRLEKEIDLLRVRYEERQRMFEAQGKAFTDRFRVDQDKIVAQLHENKIREERLVKTQSEVNQMKAQMERMVEDQKKILLEKEVQLDKQLKETARLKADYAAKLSAKP